MDGEGMPGWCGASLFCACCSSCGGLGDGREDPRAKRTTGEKSTKWETVPSSSKPIARARDMVGEKGGGRYGPRSYSTKSKRGRVSPKRRKSNSLRSSIHM